MIKKLLSYTIVFSLVFNNLAFATQSIIELDFKDSQTPQRLHVIPRMSNVGDVSHLEIDTEQKQAVVYLKEKQEEALDELEKYSSQGGDIPVITKPVILQKHNIINLPWELEAEQLTLFILNHTAWLSPLGEDGYKLEFRGSLLGGMKAWGNSYRGVTSNGNGGFELNVPVTGGSSQGTSSGGGYGGGSFSFTPNMPTIDHKAIQEYEAERDRMFAKEKHKIQEREKKLEQEKQMPSQWLAQIDKKFVNNPDLKKAMQQRVEDYKREMLYPYSSYEGRETSRNSIEKWLNTDLAVLKKEQEEWCRESDERLLEYKKKNPDFKTGAEWLEEFEKERKERERLREEKNNLKDNQESDFDKTRRLLREKAEEDSRQREIKWQKEQEERDQVRQEKEKIREIEREKNRLLQAEHDAHIQKVLEESDRIFKQNEDYKKSDQFKDARAKREMELERKLEEKRAQRKREYEEEERQKRERKEQKKKDKQKSQKDGQTVVDKPVWKQKPLDPKMRAEIEKIENRIKKLKQEEGRPFKSWLDEDDDLVSQKEETQEVEKIKPNSIRSQGKQINTVVPHNEQEKSNQTEKNKTWYKGLNEQTASKEGTSLFKNAPSQYQVTPDYFSSQAAKAGMTSSRALEILMEPTPENFYDRVILTSRQNWLGGTQDKTAFDLEGLTNGQAYKYISQGVLKKDFPALSNNLISQRGASLFQNATSDYFATQAEKAGMTSRKALDILMNPTPENFYDRVILTSRQNWLGGVQDKTTFALEGLTNGQAYKYISQGCPKEDFSALSQDLISERLRTESERGDGTGHFPKLTIANPQKNEGQTLFGKDEKTEKIPRQTRGRQLERDLEIIRKNKTWSPGMGFDKIGYEIAKNPLKAKEDALETGDFMADLFVPFYGAGKGYMEGEYTGEMALMVAGIDLIPGKKIAGAVYKGAGKLGKVIKEGLHKAPVLNKVPDFKWVVKEADHADKVGRHKKYGNIYKDPDQKVGNKEVFWSKDIGGKNAHSGEHYKLFEENGQTFDWIADVDMTGKVINKHKGEAGKYLHKKDIIWK